MFHLSLSLPPTRKKPKVEKPAPPESPHLKFEIWVLCSTCLFCLFIYLLYSQKESSNRLHRLCSWNCLRHSPASLGSSRSPSPQMWCSAARVLEWPRSVRLLISLKPQLPFLLLLLLLPPSLQPHPTTACMSYRFVVNKTQRSQLPGLESHQCLKSCQSLQRCRFCFFLNSKYKRSDFTDSIRRKDWLTQVQGHKHRVINLDPVGKTWHCKAGSRLFLYDYQLCDCC